MTATPLTSDAPIHPVDRRKDSIIVGAGQALIADNQDPIAATRDWLIRAADLEADLFVLPEYHLGHIRESGPEIKSLVRFCQESQVNLVCGAWLDQDDAPSRNAALVISRDRGYLGHYDKVHAAVGKDAHSWPPLGHEGEWHMQHGNAFPVFDLDFGTIGVLTCYDGYFPEVPHILSLHGAEILVWINGRYGSVEDFLCRSYAFTSFTHVVAANQSTGAGTQIVQYPGQVVSITSEANRDYLLHARLNLSDLREHRVNGRMFHQRRPELYGPLLENHPIWKNYPDLPQPVTMAPLPACGYPATLIGAETA